jgi:hypothetical protein
MGDKSQQAAEKLVGAVILSEAKNLCIFGIRQIQRPFLRFTQDRMRLCRNSTRKSFRFSTAGTVILSPGSFGTKDLHLSLLLETHADPSLLLRMTALAVFP